MLKPKRRYAEYDPEVAMVANPLDLRLRFYAGSWCVSWQEPMAASRSLPGDHPIDRAYEKARAHLRERAWDAVVVDLDDVLNVDAVTCTGGDLPATEVVIAIRGLNESAIHDWAVSRLGFKE